MKTHISSAGKVATAASSTPNVVVTPAVSIIPKAEIISDAAMTFQAPNAAVVTSSSTIAAASTNKRPVSLDLNKASPALKKQRLVAPSPLVLESPDQQALKTLNTPDLEKILLSSNMLQTPQPGLIFPTKVGPVTSEQEEFGKGFEEALHSLHNSKNSQAQIANNAAGTSTNVSSSVATATTAAAGTVMSGGSFTYTNLEAFPVAIKDEPQNTSISPPVSPIDMESQEKIKLERKRQRNRVAASKCRKRKLERISKLEDKVKELKVQNTDLGAVVKSLKDHVAQLKQQVIEHIETGCSINTNFNGTTLLQGK